VSTTKRWELLPNSDFSERINWRSLGNDRHAALRVHLLIIMSEGSDFRYGSIVDGYNVAPGDTIEVRKKHEQIISRTNTISEAIRYATTSRVCDQLATRVSTELAAKTLGFSGKLKSEILTKSEYEITKTTEDLLTATTSHLIQETVGDEHVITLVGSTAPREAKLRRRYWPRRWDVYLHSYEYMELAYKQRWYWKDTRKTIKQTDSGVLGWPLVSILLSTAITS
jgi:hypothetical protein